MVIERRQFLGLVLGSAMLASIRVKAARGGGIYIGCRSDGDRSYFATALDGDGGVIFDVPLPARGHGAALRPGGRECVVIARRPGHELTVIDTRHGGVAHRIRSPSSRHCYGHAVFDHAGRLLYVTENAFETGAGVVGIYDATDGYRRIGEFESHGIGPHQLVLKRDGQTLAIANGGIRTHPDSGRSKLNLSTMDPNLAYVDVSDGRLLAAYRPPPRWHQLSIRHLDIAPDDSVCLAAQFEGPANVHPPLVAVHRDAAELAWLGAPPGVYQSMRNYCGSVCLDESGELAAVSAPRGNRIVFWSLREMRCAAVLTLADGCGVAPGAAPHAFVLSSGAGGLYRCRPCEDAEASAIRFDTLDARWDNHLLRMAL
jgi:hypothetical protein